MTFADLAGVSPFSGVCSGCGCTDDNACEGGCIWANGEATLCSRCATSDAGDFINDHEDDGPEYYPEFWEDNDGP